mmetsp:Transcript_9800/g.17631  ORF Transcript_9800/g.17631 Transcript_9800/m.17631 type:complete len:417 (-) Transcript_9800:134-1384(-)
MDDLRNKLGKLFGNSKGGGGKGFRGQGHVLGSAGQSGAGSTTATSTPTARTRAPASTAAAAAPSQPAGSAASQLPVGPARTVGTGRTEATAAHKVTPPTATVDDGFVARVTEAGETAIAVLVSGGEGTPTAATLRKVLGNISSDPQNEKFHRLRMGNPKVQETVTGVPGGLELLVAAGFDVVFEPGEGGEEGWAVWRPSDDNLAALRGCLQLMNAAFPPPPAPTAPATAAVAPLPSTGPQSVPSAAEPRPRKTRVFLPNPNQVARQDPGEKFYTRSTAEVAADARARAAQREREGMLTTKAWKGRQKNKVMHTRASVRVRMPDGLMLEGEFGAKEPVDRIFSWVADALRHPWGQFELVLVHKPIQREGATATVAGQDLCPSALLSFRWIDKDPALQDGSSLSNSMISGAVPFEASL